MGDLAAPANGMSVDPTGNIVVGDGNGLEFVNEQASGSLTLYGQSIPAQSAAVIAGNSHGAAPTALRVPPMTWRRRNTSRAQSPSSTALTTSTSLTTTPGPGAGCDWVLPAQLGTLDGLSVTAGNVYKLAGNGGTTGHL